MEMMFAQVSVTDLLIISGVNNCLSLSTHSGIYRANISAQY